MTKTTPNMDFLHAKVGIGSLDDLKTTIAEKTEGGRFEPQET